MALSRYAGYKLEWIGRIRSKYGPYGSCPASDSALGAVTRPKSPNFAPVAPPTKRARGGRVTATVTARAGAVFDGSEPFASGTRAHDQKVASYEPVGPIYEVVKTALVACPIKVAVSEFRGEKKEKLESLHRNSAILP